MDLAQAYCIPLASAGGDPAAVAINERVKGLALRVGGLDRKEAEELERAVFTAGGAAYETGAGEEEKDVVLLAGSRSDFFSLNDILVGSSRSLAGIAALIRDRLKRMEAPRRLVVRNKDLLEESSCLVMGVVNVTPDSFSDGGRYLEPEAAVAHGIKLAADGADILDVGAESSRPGSDPVSRETELERLLPVIKGLIAVLPATPISVDTTKAAVAEAALEAGASIVNDISAGRFDPGLFALCARWKAPLILMHMRGVPKTMQGTPYYADAVTEVFKELEERVAAAEAEGLGLGTLVVDPGIGFGKRPEDNTALIGNLGILKALGYPIMVGASRKSLIGALTGAPVEERLPGTLALNVAALLGGASIFRVHDVKEHVQALACAIALKRVG